MPSGWFIRNVSTDLVAGQVCIEISSVTMPESPVTFPKSVVTMPKRPVTLFRNTHPQFDVFHLQAMACQQLRYRKYRANAHFIRLTTGHGHAAKGAQGLAYNFKRVLSILGIERTRRAMQLLGA